MLRLFPKPLYIRPSEGLLIPNIQCRVRRVKCDNTRPFCRKCIDYDRQCGGYERETVFIVGTPDDRGRVGSHPARSVQRSRSRGSESSSRQATGFELVVAEPLQPAWNETVLLHSESGSHLVRIVARHVDLNSAINNGGLSPQANEVTLSLLDSRPLDVAPTFMEETFDLKSFCFVHLPETSDDSTAEPDEGLCLFLYQV